MAEIQPPTPVYVFFLNAFCKLNGFGRQLFGVGLPLFLKFEIDNSIFKSHMEKEATHIYQTIPKKKSGFAG